MFINKNDPRLIDFVLGEMEPDEARAFEEALFALENAEARQAIREYRELSRQMVSALQEEPSDGLLPEQRARVLRKASVSNLDVRRVDRKKPWSWPAWAALVAAAGLVAITAWVTLVLPQRNLERITTAYRPGTVSDLPQPAQGPSPAESKRNEMDIEAATDAPATASAASPLREDTAAGIRPLAVGRQDPTPTVPPPTPAEVSEPDTMDSLGYHATVSRENATARKAERSYLAEASPQQTVLPMPMPMPEPLPPIPYPVPDGEKYLPISENAFLRVTDQPLSTFSIDVDTASYANIRRLLQQGRMPHPDAVRIEEMINYFKYDLPKPVGADPFSLTLEMADCPWMIGHKLLRIGLRGREVAMEERPPANLVFLVDVSGSMDHPNKLPLVRESLRLLLDQLRPDDRVAIVTYAGEAGVRLASTPCSDKAAIRAAIDSLTPGGSTHGSAGIVEAYRIARAHFVPGGINRVLLATDGDFNVGVTGHDALMDLIAEQAHSRVFLTVLGFGYGNIKDATLEQLANKGNGNYAYIDTFSEARRVLVEQISGALVTIAKDVKIQVEFNPQHVQAYRLIGYENRALAARDFNDDTKDAGEIGAGHQCTVLYQLVPHGARMEPEVDPLKYQSFAEPVRSAALPQNPEWLTVKLRYKQPEEDISSKIEVPWATPGGNIHQASADLRFAASVAAFGMLLRDSPNKGTATFDLVLELARSARGDDAERVAFADLVVTAKTLARR